MGHNGKLSRHSWEWFSGEETLMIQTCRITVNESVNISVIPTESCRLDTVMAAAGDSDRVGQTWACSKRVHIAVELAWAGLGQWNNVLGKGNIQNSAHREETTWRIRNTDSFTWPEYERQPWWPWQRELRAAAIATTWLLFLCIEWSLNL